MIENIHKYIKKDVCYICVSYVVISSLVSIKQAMYRDVITISDRQALWYGINLAYIPLDEIEKWRKLKDKIYMLSWDSYWGKITSDY